MSIACLLKVRFAVLHLPLPTAASRCVSAASRKRREPDIKIMAEAQAVKSRLLELLPTLDLHTATERQIRETLSQDFGPVDAHKALIKSTIEEFLLNGAASHQEPNEAANASIDAEPAATKKSKRKAVQEMADESNVAKLAKLDANGTYVLPLSPSGLRQLSISNLNGKVLVDMRDYFKDRDSGEMRPGKKGIALSIEQWEKLVQGLPLLQQSQAEGKDGVLVQLSNNRRAYTSEFQGKIGIHVREFYGADDEQKPTQKGVMLDAAALAALISHAPEISARVGASNTTLHANHANGNSKPAAPSTGTKPAAASTSAVQKATMAAANGHGTTSLGVNEGFVDIGADKRVTLSEFRGSMFVDLREYYTAGDEKKPGKKGISLRPSDWRTIAQHAKEISAALEAHDLTYILELSGKKRVTLSELKNKYYVGIREFYQSGGEMKPGAKGLSMTPEQWDKLVNAIPRIEAGLSAINH